MFRTRLGTAALVAVVSLPALLPAQDTAATRNGWELLLSSGALLPTGAQRDAIKTANLSTAQLLYVIRSRFAITAMGGWARSRDLSTADDTKLDVFTFDVGLEARAPRLALSKSASFTPFVGAGAGSRSYNHRGLDVDATHNVAGYAAAGGELAKGRVRVRAEVRDYVTGFRPLVGIGKTAARNDVVALAGLRLVRR
jgi:hypothetical protein